MGRGRVMRDGLSFVLLIANFAGTPGTPGTPGVCGVRGPVVVAR